MMLTIVGGTYREVCYEPDWNQLFGSGLRAAIAASTIIVEAAAGPVKLITWECPEEQAELRLRAESFGVTTEIHDRGEAIEFQYQHGLSDPMNSPPRESLTRVSQARFDLETVLMFGLLEDRLPESTNNNITINAKTLVYDPQSKDRSIPWSATGSHADRLAIVANFAEAQAMARRLGIKPSRCDWDARELGRCLLEAENAEVVIVKKQAEGAFVITDEHDAHHVCSYKSETVFPFGSGDVFSGIFAAYWAAMGADPVEAAQRASAAAAYYCNSRILPIPSDNDEVMKGITPHKIPIGSEGRPKHMVYIAGPLFNFQQRWFIDEVKRCLEDNGVETFSPFHAVGTKGKPEEIAKEDIDGLVKCTAVFAIVDGLDAGTIFEIGYAVALGKPVFAFGQCTSDSDLLMVAGSPGCRIYRDFPTAIYHAAWKALES
jgi:hypothetical protein